MTRNGGNSGATSRPDPSIVGGRLARRAFLQLVALTFLAGCTSRLTTAPGRPAATGSLVPSAAAQRSRVFYLDSEDGMDIADGLTEATAWATLAPLRLVTLGPGDKVLFRRGGKWKGGVTINGSGAPMQPIVLGAWGQGAPPIIDGEG